MIKKLLVLVLGLVISASAHAQADSLGIEKKGEQVFVIHKVKSGQTLYALARRYGTSVKKINEANPALQQGLKVGQTLKVPFEKTIVVPKKVAQAAKTHSVARGETLYAISRKYGVSVDDLKRMNRLNSNALALGQKLIVEEAKVVEEVLSTTQPDPEPVKEEVTEQATQAIEETEKPAEVTLNTEINETDTTKSEAIAVSTTAVQNAPETVSYNGTPFKEVKEEGVAELIVEDEPANKFLALHKTAKVGTVIKIRNLKNDLAVYVRVVGNIPETADNDNILIKINKRAHDQLKAFDPRLRVELTYFQ